METEMQTPEDTIAAGAEAMGAVMAEYPDLTDFGFGVSAEQTFDVERLKLTEDRSLSQFSESQTMAPEVPEDQNSKPTRRFELRAQACRRALHRLCDERRLHRRRCRRRLHYRTDNR